MTQKQRCLYTEIERILEVKQTAANLFSTMVKTLNDPKILRKTSNTLVIQRSGKAEIKDIIFD